MLGVLLISVCSRFERRVVCRSGSEHSGSTEASWFKSKAFRWWLVFVSLPGCMKIELVNFKKCLCSWNVVPVMWNVVRFDRGFLLSEGMFEGCVFAACRGGNDHSLGQPCSRDHMPKFTLRSKAAAVCLGKKGQKWFLGLQKVALFVYSLIILLFLTSKNQEVHFMTTFSQID